MTKFKPIIYLENNDINRFNLIINFLKKNYYPYYFEKNGKIIKLKKYLKGNILFLPKKSYNNIANYYKEIASLDLAVTYYNQAIEISDKIYFLDISFISNRVSNR